MPKLVFVLRQNVTHVHITLYQSTSPPPAYLAVELSVFALLALAAIV
jgi:hypothetical protein